ncbi:hypothetical protein VE04_02002 [Pseudogymnoascus sp. 24MN13]|nr:hypothetical protein VE04_02002 [Pseudogymnoascus sp. 24MN13]
MKFQLSTFVGLLLPLTALAAPTAEDATALADVVDARSEAHDTSPEALGLEARKVTTCIIINSDSKRVNCRKGPGFSYPDIGESVYIEVGNAYPFGCYKKGDCYQGNCTWQKLATINCYVNGYYTDPRCTAAALGKC